MSTKVDCIWGDSTHSTRSSGTYQQHEDDPSEIYMVILMQWFEGKFDDNANHVDKNHYHAEDSALTDTISWKDEPREGAVELEYTP